MLTIKQLNRLRRHAEILTHHPPNDNERYLNKVYHLLGCIAGYLNYQALETYITTGFGNPTELVSEANRE